MGNEEKFARTQMAPLVGVSEFRCDLSQDKKPDRALPLGHLRKIRDQYPLVL